MQRLEQGRGERVGRIEAHRAQGLAQLVGEEARQVVDDLLRQVGPRRQLELQRLVVAGVVHELAEALHREARAGIGGEQLEDDAAAALHQRIGDELRQRLAARDGLEMLVRARSAQTHQVLVGQDRRALQHRARHGDVVDGERDDDAARQRSALSATLSDRPTRPATSTSLQDAQDDLLEQGVLGDVALGDAVIEEIGDAAQKGAALLRGRLARQLQQVLAQHVSTLSNRTVSGAV